MKRWNFSLKNVFLKNWFFLGKNCLLCKVECNYTNTEILNIGQTSLNIELGKHNHPKSRIIGPKKTQRLTQDGRLELIEHYNYAHGKNILLVK